MTECTAMTYTAKDFKSDAKPVLKPKVADKAPNWSEPVFW